MSNEAEMVLVDDAILEDKVHFQKKIQDEWMPDIMAWAATGLSLEKMTKKIEAKWGLKVTPSGLRYKIKRMQHDRSAVSKAVVRDNVGIHITNDLEVLKIKKQELLELSNQFKASQDWKNYFQTDRKSVV